MPDELGTVSLLVEATTFDNTNGYLTAMAIERQLTPGDANGDGNVDVSDLGILATNYGTGGGMGWENADFTGDGTVDVSDLGILATAYADAQSQTVPEPGSLALFLAILVPFALWRRAG